MSTKQLLDLRWLNAVSADFHLPIRSAHELNAAVVVPPSEVTGGVSSLLYTVNINQWEPVESQVGIAKIAASDTGTGDEDLPELVTANGQSVAVEDVHASGVELLPEGNAE